MPHSLARPGKGALDVVEQITRDMQNPSTASDESGSYTWTRQHPIAGVVMPFYGQALVQGRLLRNAALEWANAERGAAKTKAGKSLLLTAGGLLGSAAVAAAITAGFGAAMRGGFGDDDKEKTIESYGIYALGELMDDLTPGVARFSRMAYQIVKDALKADSVADALASTGRHIGQSDRVFFDNIFGSVLYKGGDSLYQAAKWLATREAWRVERAAANAIESLGSLGGLPVGGPVQAAKAAAGLAGHRLGRGDGGSASCRVCNEDNKLEIDANEDRAIGANCPWKLFLGIAGSGRLSSNVRSGI